MAFVKVARLVGRCAVVEDRLFLGDHIVYVLIVVRFKLNLHPIFVSCFFFFLTHLVENWRVDVRVLTQWLGMLRLSRVELMVLGRHRLDCCRRLIDVYRLHFIAVLVVDALVLARLFNAYDRCYLLRSILRWNFTLVC